MDVEQAQTLGADAEDTTTVDNELSQSVVDDESGDGAGAEKWELQQADIPLPHDSPANIPRPPSPPVEPLPHEPHPDPGPQPNPDPDPNPPPNVLPPLPRRRRPRLGPLRVRVRNWMREGARDAVGFVLDSHGAWAVVAIILVVASTLLCFKLILHGASLAFPGIPWPVILNAANTLYQTSSILSRPPDHIRVNWRRNHERLGWWFVRAMYAFLLGCDLVVFLGAWDVLRDSLREIERKIACDEL